MVVVDTSIWIRFLTAKEPFATELDQLLAENEVLAHDLVYGELFMGERSGRAKLLIAYSEMHRAPSVAHEEVVELVRSRRLGGRAIGWIDAQLLASALVAGSRLWTAVAALQGIAVDLAIDHRPTQSG
jgi:predicted nucleic acid-binding protein